MTVGIVLLILGAIFTFAIRSDGTWIDTRALGVILMLGGLAFIARARLGRREVVVQEDETADGADERVREHRVVVEKRVE